MDKANLLQTKFRPTPVIEEAKVSTKYLGGGLIAYGANTHNGITRTYNEDRISIVLDLKSQKVKHTQNVKFFAVFDGHGGLGCAEYLRDSLHNLIASSQYFPIMMQ